MNSIKYQLLLTHISNQKYPPEDEKSLNLFPKLLLCFPIKRNGSLFKNDLSRPCSPVIGYSKCDNISMLPSVYHLLLFIKKNEWKIAC